MSRAITDWDNQYNEMRRTPEFKSKLHQKKIIAVYREQILTFTKLGIGNRTDFGTLITKDLIDITKKRLVELREKFGVKRRYTRKKVA